MTTPASVEVGSHDAAVPVVIDHFCRLFNELDKGNLYKLQHVYSENIRFQDPFGQAEGLDELTKYFAEAYSNVISCQFRFGEAVIQQNRCAIPWVMELRHKRLCRGQLVTVDGISHLDIRNGRVCYHRDYFDAGQLLYENLPLLGGLIRRIREHAG